MSYYVVCMHVCVYIYIYIERERDRKRESKGGLYQRHINGVASNGVLPKSQICKLVAKPAPDIFRIQGVYHNVNVL